MIRIWSNTLRNPKNAYFASVLRYQSTIPEREYFQSTPSSVDTSKSETGVKSIPGRGKKLPKREPLVKNFFVGKVDKELLAFPEVISREDMTELHKKTAEIQAFFDSIDDREFDAAKSIPRDVIRNIRKLGLYGANVPEAYGGWGWQWSESLIANAHEAKAVDIAVGLLSHRTVIDTLNEIGTDAQKEQFLPKLANGTLLATEAIFEFDNCEDGFFNTTAKYDNDEAVWVVNGEKAFVVNGPSAGIFLVIAQTVKANMAEDVGKMTTIFLIEKSTPGVKIGEEHQTIGCRGLSISKVQFENVKVPDSCLLGRPNEGNIPADTILQSSRLRSSLIGQTLSKRILDELAQYSIKSKQLGTALKDLESVKKSMQQMATNTYAMESMIYLTAGLLDEFDSQDVGMESALTKYYTLTRLYENASRSLDILGPKSLLAGQSNDVDFRNALQLYTQGEPLDSLRMYIVLTGLQHAGIILNDTVRKSRNPLFNPGHIFSKLMQSSSIDNPKLRMPLKESLHPSLEAAAQCIERCVVRLNMCVELLLTKYAQDVVEKHNEINRVTEMAAHIYAMFASTSRASRSYCIGLKLSDYEMLTALTICAEADNKVKWLAHEIFQGPYINNDNNMHRLSKQIFKSGGYFAEHPLTFNF